MEEGIHIALSAEKITEFFGLPITNTLITSWIVVALLAALALFVSRNLKLNAHLSPTGDKCAHAHC